jgi:hypothetical protein
MEFTLIKPVSLRRRKKQSGLEALEFGLWALLMLPAMIWTFLSGMNFIRYNKGGDVTRSAAMMYIKGADLTLAYNQRLLVRVANGLDLQVETTPNSGVISNSLGSGLVVMTKIYYAGSGCGCTNANKYVIAERIYAGNRSLVFNGSTVESFSGPPPTGIWNSTSGVVSNYYTDSRAVASNAVATLWGSALADGQFFYMVETFFKSPTFGANPFDSSGVYNRVFM